MRLPDFLIIGAAKSGTTALARYLDQHPGIFVCPMKETDFFGFDPVAPPPGRLWDDARHTFPVRTLPQYAALFAEAGAARLAGEASPLYLESPLAAGRIRATIPEVRLVAVLRNPVDRAWSGYLMNVLQNRERELSPAHALGPDSHYVQVGFYAAQVRRYLDLFPRDQLRVYLHDDLTADPAGLMRDLFGFLGADAGFVPDVGVRHNEGGYPRRRRVNALLNHPVLKRSLGPLAPEPLKRFVNDLRRRNTAAAPRMDQATRERLSALYRDDILVLQDLLGRDLGGWLAANAQGV